MIKINTSGDYVQLIYVDPVGESVQQELKSDTDAFECSYDSNGSLYLQFGLMRFENPDPTDFTINGVAVTDAADFISKLNALFTGGGGGGGWGTSGTIATLTGNGTVDLDGNQLIFKNDENLLVIENRAIEGYDVGLFQMLHDNNILSFGTDTDTETFQVNMHNDAGDGNNGRFKIEVGGGSSVVNTMTADFNDGTKVSTIIQSADVSGTSVAYTADTHTFNGVILSPDTIPLDFVDDAAAAAGGVAVGQLYHTAGAVKIRLS